MGDKHRFWWFKGASVVELANRLAAADPTTARLEVRIDADDKMTFRVVATSADVLLARAATIEPDINESFLCPPFCP